MKYVFSSLVALGLVSSALGLTTAQAADRYWVCELKKIAVEAGPEVALSWAEHRHYIYPTTANGARWQLMRILHDKMPCARE